MVKFAYIGKVVDLAKEGKRRRNDHSSNLVNTTWESIVSIYLSKWVAEKFFKVHSRYFGKA